MADVTLLECPFCGESVEFKQSHIAGEGGYIEHRRRHCLAIDGALSESDNAALIAKWNTRTAPALTPKQAAADEMFEALENCAELLNVAMERLGVCGEGDSGQRRADAEFPGGVAALHAARAALAKAGQP